MINSTLQSDGAPAEVASSPDDHIILAGQSNALGFLNNGPAPYDPTWRVQIWSDTDGDGTPDAWNYMRPGVNTGTLANPAAWGAEVEIANRWLADHPDGVLWIVKVAKGSTGLAEDPLALDWSPHSHGEMFDIATAAINAARHNLDGGGHAFAQWDVLDWMQGETDAQDAAKADAYGLNVREFITDARAGWAVEDVAVARITDTAGPYSLAVRNAQWNLDNGDDPLADVHSFKTIGFAMAPDHLHYAPEGQIALGDAFFDAWLV